MNRPLLYHQFIALSLYHQLSLRLSPKDRKEILDNFKLCECFSLIFLLNNLDRKGSARDLGRATYGGFTLIILRKVFNLNSRMGFGKLI